MAAMALDTIAGANANNRVAVPIITYHSIADVKDHWQFRHLSCPVAVFESHLRALQRGGFQAITLHQLYSYVAQGKEIPPRSVVLTFDDGYLDNWVYAYPLLKRYRFHGTIFVSPDFVDPSGTPRPNLEGVWSGKASLDELPSAGFLSWEEMRLMEASGCVDLQSHALTHTWYFTSPEIVDFHHPGDSYPWLAWNACPEHKHLWMTEAQEKFVLWGTPVYRHEKSLVARRYFPDRALDAVLTKYVRSHGEAAFFQRAEWRRQLEGVAAEYHHAHTNQGRYESESAHVARLCDELAGSKQIIERHLSKRVDFLCWPGGGYTDSALAFCKEAGYLASVHSSWDLSVQKNRFGADPAHFSRISPPASRWSETDVEYKGGLHLVCLLNSVRGSHLHTVMYRALKIPFKLRQLTARRPASRARG
jgi:peptidoglycan/xylan/chitin deacetylase (PgdA/CDA1 family)